MMTQSAKKTHKLRAALALREKVIGMMEGLKPPDGVAMRTRRALATRAVMESEGEVTSEEEEEEEEEEESPYNSDERTTVKGTVEHLRSGITRGGVPVLDEPEETPEKMQIDEENRRLEGEIKELEKRIEELRNDESLVTSDPEIIHIGEEEEFSNEAFGYGEYQELLNMCRYVAESVPDGGRKIHELLLRRCPSAVDGGGDQDASVNFEALSNTDLHALYDLVNRLRTRHTAKSTTAKRRRPKVQEAPSPVPEPQREGAGVGGVGGGGGGGGGSPQDHNSSPRLTVSSPHPHSSSGGIPTPPPHHHTPRPIVEDEPVVRAPAPPPLVEVDEEMIINDVVPMHGLEGLDDL